MHCNTQKNKNKKTKYKKEAANQPTAAHGAMLIESEGLNKLQQSEDLTTILFVEILHDCIKLDYIFIYCIVFNCPRMYYILTYFVFGA